MFSALGLAGMLGMFGFEQNILSEYSHSLEFLHCLFPTCQTGIILFYSIPPKIAMAINLRTVRHC